MLVPSKFSFVTRIFASGSIALAASFSIAAQVRNNPYSPSPSRNPRVSTIVTPVSVPPTAVALVTRESGPSAKEPISVPAPIRTSPAKPIEKSGSALTEIYKVAPGDILLINLKNSPQGTGFYTVRSDGFIDYPLGGGYIKVAKLTLPEIATSLTSGIKLFANPQIDVKVHQFLSHPVIVSGLVNNGGEKYLRREAMPLYVVRAEADVQREAKQVVITRAGSGISKLYDLADRETDNLLIYPGDSLDFVADKSKEAVGKN